MVTKSKYFFLASFVTVSVNFLTLPLFTAYLSPSDYGLIGLFMLFGSTVVNLFSFGLNTASYGLFFKLTTEGFRYLNTTVFIFLIVVFSLVGICLIFPFAESISNYLFDGKLSSDVLILSFLNGCLAYFYVYYGQLLVAQERSLTYACVVIFQVSLNALVTFYFLAFQNMSFMGAIFGALIANATAFIIMLLCNYESFVLNVSFEKILRALKFGWPEMPNIVVSILYGGFDKTMLLNYKGLNEVGHYEFGGKFAGILKIFMDGMGKSFSPLFLKKIKTSNEEDKRDIISNFYVMAFIVTFLGLCISYFSEEALIILTTREYYAAKYIVPVLVIYYLFGLLGQLSMNQLIAAEKLYVLAPISASGLALNVAMNVLLIPAYGAIGAAVATAFSALIKSILQAYFGNKVSPLSVGFLKLFSLYCLLFLFMILGYFIMMSEISFLVKAAIKLLLLLVFFAMGVKFKFVEFSWVTQSVASLSSAVKVLLLKR